MRPGFTYHLIFALFFALAVSSVQAQTTLSKWGPNDTIIVSAIIYNGESMPFKELEMVYVSNLSPDELAKFVQAYNRLRNAVYVTYPYARTAGITLNDVNAHLEKVSKGNVKNILNREKRIKGTIRDPLSNLSVYQGRVLMKLINRQTGNNCYSIIKEYRGGCKCPFLSNSCFLFSEAALSRIMIWCTMPPTAR
jgi:hypothetical protein